MTAVSKINLKKLAKQSSKKSDNEFKSPKLRSQK